MPGGPSVGNTGSAMGRREVHWWGTRTALIQSPACMLLKGQQGYQERGSGAKWWQY